MSLFKQMVEGMHSHQEPQYIHISTAVPQILASHCLQLTTLCRLQSKTMATMETAAGKTVPESGYDHSSPPIKFSGVDLGLRVFLFALSLSALIVLVTSKQTTLIPVVFQPPLAFVSVAAKFNHSPALIYLLVALCVTCLYSLLTAISSLRLIYSQAASTKILFQLVLFDVLMAGIMASATGSAGAVAYIGLKGNSHTRWAKICGVYGKFCRHVGSSTALSLAASVILFVLSILSAHSLYRRSR